MVPQAHPLREESSPRPDTAPISPAFRFGSLETVGCGWVLEDAPYAQGKHQVSSILQVSCLWEKVLAHR